MINNIKDTIWLFIVNNYNNIKYLSIWLVVYIVLWLL